MLILELSTEKGNDKFINCADALLIIRPFVATHVIVELGTRSRKHWPFITMKSSYNHAFKDVMAWGDPVPTVEQVLEEENRQEEEARIRRRKRNLRNLKEA